MQVRVFDALADMAASTIAGWLRTPEGPVSLSLAGGGSRGTPYARLRDEDVPWDRVTAWLGDERWVSPEHPDNKDQMVRRALLDDISARFDPMPWEEGSPEAAAARYEEILRGFLVTEDDRFRSEVVILGTGRGGPLRLALPRHAGPRGERATLRGQPGGQARRLATHRHPPPLPCRPEDRVARHGKPEDRRCGPHAGRGTA